MPFTTKDLEDAVDIAGLAIALKTSKRSAERIVASGDIDTIRVGTGRGSIRIPLRAIDDYINRRATKARKASA